MSRRSYIFISHHEVAEDHCHAALVTQILEQTPKWASITSNGGQLGVSKKLATQKHCRRKERARKDKLAPEKMPRRDGLQMKKRSYGELLTQYNFFFLYQLRAQVL